MKNILILLSVVLSLGIYSYYWIIVPETEIDREKRELSLVRPAEEISELRLSTKSMTVKLENRENIWWVTEPHEYVANQDFIYKTLSIMNEAPVIENFPLEKDLYGFEPGEAFIEIKYKNTMNLRYIVAKNKAPQNSLYILNKDSNHVYVVHNVWGQFFYYLPDNYYSPVIPVPGEQIKAVTMLDHKSKLWEIRPKDAKTLEVQWDGKTSVSEKSQWIWFFKKLRELKFQELDFKKAESFKHTKEMLITSEKGNIRILFDEINNKSYIPSLNVFALVKAEGLKSLEVEIKKVIESDKK